MAAVTPIPALPRPKSSYVADMLVLIAVFQRATGVSDYALSDTLFNRGSQLRLLREGKKDIHSELVERSIIWLAMNWPKDAVWPVHIAKPSSDRVALYAQRPAAGESQEGSAVA